MKSKPSHPPDVFSIAVSHPPLPTSDKNGLVCQQTSEESPLRNTDMPYIVMVIQSVIIFITLSAFMLYVFSPRGMPLLTPTSAPSFTVTFETHDPLVLPAPPTPHVEHKPPSVPSLHSHSMLGKFKKAAVVSDHGICSEIGRSILTRGGNAIDAAIGTLFCVGVTNPQSSGIGGGFFMQVYQKEKGACTTINARETAPREVNVDDYKKNKHHTRWVITNVLTMMFMSLDSKADSPKTDYPTALDVYICICLFFLFICMVEFTIVHYFTKLNTGDPEMLELERERMRHIIRSIPKRSVLSSRHHNRPFVLERNRKVTVNGRCNGPDRPPTNRLSIRRKDGGRHSFYHKKKLGKITHQPLSVQNSEPTPMEKEDFHRDAIGWRLYHFMLDQNSQYDPFLLEGNSISAIDKVCRVALPVIFGAVVLVYYQIYVGTPFYFHFDDPRGPSLL